MFSIFLFILFDFYIKVLTTKFDESSAVITAISQITVEHFVSHKETFNIAYYRATSDRFQQKLVTSIFQGISAATTCHLIYHKTESRFSKNLKENTIHLFQSFESFESAANQSSNLKEIDNPQTKHVIYINNATPRDLARLSYKEFSVYQINFILDVNELSVQLSTFSYFTKNSCGQMSLDVVNTFSKITRKWKTHEFFPKKHQDFYGCPVNILYTHDPPRNYLSDDNKSKGFNVDLIKLIAKILNFRPNFMEMETFQYLKATNKSLDIAMYMQSVSSRTNFVNETGFMFFKITLTMLLSETCQWSSSLIRSSNFHSAW